MSCARSKTEFLAARDARQALLDRACRMARETGSKAVLFISVNVPGADKNRPGVDRLVESAVSALHRAGVPTRAVAADCDPLGPYRLLLVSQSPATLKAATVALEADLPGGRVLDIDVLTPDGEPVDRQALGLKPRTCYVCDQPARECMLLKRHTLAELLAAVDAQIALAHAA
jgi:holo-ACP synthase CitX